MIGKGEKKTKHEAAKIGTVDKTVGVSEQILKIVWAMVRSSASLLFLLF